MIFTKGYRRRLCQLSLNDQILVMKIYVDDLNQVGYCLPIGSRYVNGKLYIPGKGWRGRAAKGQALPPERLREIEQEAEEAHALGGNQEKREAESASIYRMIANEVRPLSIKMKEDVPDNHPNKMLPILDTQMRVVDGQIVHHHFSKPMASLEITLGRSALSQSSKLNIMTQEGNRRLRNTSKEIP